MIKAKVYLNRIQIDIKAEFARAEQYFKKHGVDLIFSFIESDYKNPKPEIFPLNVGYRIFLPMKVADLLPVDSTQDLTMFVFNQEEFSIKKMPTGRYYFYKDRHIAHIGTHRGNPQDLTYIEICHEIMHFLTSEANQKGFNIPDHMDTYWNNSDLEMENSNFGQQWKLLETYIKSLQPKIGLKHFTPDEVKGLTEDFKKRLDVGREESGIAWALTSTLRTPEHNKKVGGSPTSAHLDGTGADVRARNWVEVGKIVEGARKAGITGITVYTKSPHVHLDMKGFRLEVKDK